MSATSRSTRRALSRPSRPNLRRCAHAPGRASCAQIFLGGGTPSLMEPATVGAILDAVARHWTVPARHRGHARGQSLLGRGRAVSRLPRRRRQSRLAGRAGAERRRFALSRPPAQCRPGAARDPPCARDLSAPVLRPDLCAAPADARGVGGRAGTRPSRSPPTICRSTNSPSRRARASTHCMRRERLSSRTRTSRPISMR